MTPGNAHRSIRTAERRLGLRLLVGQRGGRHGGSSTLTTAGHRVARRNAPVVPSTTIWPCRLVGRAKAASPLKVVVPDAGVSAVVAPMYGELGPSLSLPPRGRLDLEIGPTAVTILRRPSKTPTSARNLWPARVASIGPAGRFGIRLVDLEVGALRIVAAITATAAAQLRLAVGSKVVAQAKATALRLRVRDT